MRRSFRHNLFLVSLLWLMVLCTAHSQIDPRAQELLDAYEGRVQSQQETRLPQERRSLDITLAIELYEPDGTRGGETRTRLVADLPRRRLVTITDTPVTASRIVYQDGTISMLNAFTGDVELVPEDQQAQFQKAYEATLEQFEQPARIRADYGRARYDGVRSYGGVLRGEQVTLTLAEGSLPFHGLMSRSAEQRLIFGEHGELLGMVAESTDSGTLVMVYDDPNPTRSVPLHLLDATGYTLQDGKAVRSFRLRLEDYKLNEPLDEHLFDLKAAAKREPFVEARSEHLLREAELSLIRLGTSLIDEEEADTVNQAYEEARSALMALESAYADSGTLRQAFWDDLRTSFEALGDIVRSGNSEEVGSIVDEMLERLATIQ